MNAAQSTRVIKNDAMPERERVYVSGSELQKSRKRL